MASSYSAYSYRSDPCVPAFDDSHPLLIFDGHCVLCSRGVAFMLRHDPNGRARMAAIQNPIPQALYLHYGLDAKAFDTFMVLSEGKPFVRWAGVCKAARLMPAPWKWLGVLGGFVPTFVGDTLYDWVQRNRIGWFGARAQCFLPDGDMKTRFL